MDYKPIFDKVIEIIEFCTEAAEEILGKAPKHNRLNFLVINSKFTRKYITYATIGRLYTPFGSIFIPYFEMLNDDEVIQLNERLFRKFGFVRLWSLPPNNTWDMYCVPFDHKLPEIPGIDASMLYWGQLDDTHQHASALYRENEDGLRGLYLKLKTGDADTCIHRPEIEDEFNKWLDEVSKVDDRIPFSLKTKRDFQSLLESRLESMRQKN
jgi:hypothetical protein